MGSLSPWGVTWALTRPPGVQSAASRGCLQPPQARHSHAELSAFSSPPARRTVPESNVAVCLHAFPLPAPRPVRQRGLPLHPHRPQARLPSPPLSGLPDAQWPVQRRREPLRVPPDLPPHSLTLCHMPASLCSTRRPSLRFQTVRLPRPPRVLPPQPSDPVPSGGRDVFPATLPGSQSPLRPSRHPRLPIEAVIAVGVKYLFISETVVSVSP